MRVYFTCRNHTTVCGLICKLDLTEQTVRTNYILIDFESVQTTSLEQLTHDHFKVIVFVGANQARLPFEVAASLQPLDSARDLDRAEYRVPADALAALPAGGRFLWQVDLLLPGGEQARSKTFFARIE